MKIKMISFLALGLFYFSTSAVAKDQLRVMDKQLRLFDSLIQGEFDNYNQVNFETNDFLDQTDKVKEKHSRLYMRITKVNAPQIGANVYYQQMHNGDRHTPVYRQVLLVVRADHNAQTLYSQSYKFKQPDKYQNLWETPEQTALKLSDLKTIGENCGSHFNLVGGIFMAETRYQDCVVPSKHGGVIHIASKTVLSEDEYWHLEGGYSPEGKMRFGRKDGVPIKMRRAKRFRCWAGLKTDNKKPDGEYQWDFFSGLSLHNQGDVAYFSRSDIADGDYFIRLKETIFPAGKRPDVLEIFVHQATQEAKTNYKKALSYTWTNNDARMLGINLRWLQASCSIDNSFKS